MENDIPMRNTGFILSFLLLFAEGISAQPGSLDATFGDNGIVITDFDLMDQYGYNLLIQADGKIVVTGFSKSVKQGCPADFDFALVRYHPDGTVDEDFGDNGLASKTYGLADEECPGDDFGLSAILQPDGKIIVGGQSIFSSSTAQCVLVRFTPEGIPDNSFGVEGVSVVPFSTTNAVAEALAFQSDGKLVLAGGSFNGSDMDIALARLFPGGGTDDSFGTNGILTTDFGGSDEGALSVSIQSDGRIVVMGFSEDRIALVRYLSDGSLDDSFGDGGIVTTDLSGSGESGRDMVIQPDGKIVVAGSVTRSSLSCPGGNCVRKFAIVRYNPDGTLDDSFGAGDPFNEQAGVVETSVGNIDEVMGDFANALILQPDGKIVAAGHSARLGFGSPAGDFALARYHSDGTLDESFNDLNPFTPQGVVLTSIFDFSAEFDVINAIALQPDGLIVVAGNSTTGGPDGNNFAVARYLSGLTVGAHDQHRPAIGALLYPNPVNSEAVLEYELSGNESVTVQLLDVYGRVVKTFLTQERRSEGKQRDTLFFPEWLPAGIYTLAIHTPREIGFLKMILR